MFCCLLVSNVAGENFSINWIVIPNIVYLWCLMFQDHVSLYGDTLLGFIGLNLMICVCHQFWKIFQVSCLPFFTLLRDVGDLIAKASWFWGCIWFFKVDKIIWESEGVFLMTNGLSSGLRSTFAQLHGEEVPIICILKLL